jgi:hypothetical protein
MMVVRLGRFLNAVTRRCSTCTSAWACFKALRTVCPHTPASAAMCPIVRAQRPCAWCSAATTARTACSASVKRAANAGGKAPEAAQRRRRSIEAGERGRDPERRRMGFWTAGRAFLASMASDRACASASLTCPAAYAFQSRELTFDNSARGDASMARRNCSADMRNPLGVGPAREGYGDAGQAPSSPEHAGSSLTEGRVFGDDHVAKR